MRASSKIIERKLSRLSPYSKRATIWGQCERSGLIKIDPRLRPIDYLDTLIHELLHREIPQLDEDIVMITAKRMSREIWGKNFRRIQS